MPSIVFRTRLTRASNISYPARSSVCFKASREPTLRPKSKLLERRRRWSSAPPQSPDTCPTRRSHTRFFGAARQLRRHTDWKCTSGAKLLSMTWPVVLRGGKDGHAPADAKFSLESSLLAACLARGLGALARSLRRKPCRRAATRGGSTCANLEHRPAARSAALLITAGRRRLGREQWGAIERATRATADPRRC